MAAEQDATDPASSGLFLSVAAEVDELERRAAAVLHPDTSEYVFSGIGSGAGVNLARRAFGGLHLIPRPLPTKVAPDMSVSLLGVRYPTPVMVAPMGFLGDVCADPDIGLARAAAAAGVAPM